MKSRRQSALESLSHVSLMLMQPAASLVRSETSENSWRCLTECGRGDPRGVAVRTLQFQSPHLPPACSRSLRRTWSHERRRLDAHTRHLDSTHDLRPSHQMVGYGNNILQSQTPGSPEIFQVQETAGRPQLPTKLVDALDGNGLQTPFRAPCL